MSLVALVCAGLLLRSFQNASRSNLGLLTEGLLLASVNLDLQGYDEEAGRSFYRQLTARVGDIPGVDAASLGWLLPLDAYTEGARVLADETVDRDDEHGISVLYSVVAEDYFETVGTSLLRGRVFRVEDTEDAPSVVVVNETLAGPLWPDGRAVGRRLRFGAEGPPVEVVGVAADGKYMALGEDPRPYLWLPLLQNHGAPMTILLRTAGAPRALEARLRSEVRALDPSLPVYGVKSIGEYLDRTLAPARAMAVTVSFFALLAVTLATFGLYGLMAFLVTQRRRELGIRMALGAGKREILTLLLGQAARLVALGLALGLAIALALGRVLESVLFGVGGREPGILGAVAVLLALVALAGSFGPSRRAARLDPVVTLRHD